MPDVIRSQRKIEAITGNAHCVQKYKRDLAHFQITFGVGQTERRCYKRLIHQYAIEYVSEKD